MIAFSPQRSLQKVSPDEESIRNSYVVLGDALRRKAFEEVSRIALPTYKTAGQGEQSRLYSKDVAQLKARSARFVRTSYGFDVRYVKIKGGEAFVQSIESGRQSISVKGHRQGELLWGVRRDIWQKVAGQWRLAMTYFPNGFHVYFDTPSKRRTRPDAR